MMGGIYLGMTYLGGAPGISGVKRFLRATLRLLNGLRTISQIRS